MDQGWVIHISRNGLRLDNVADNIFKSCSIVRIEEVLERAWLFFLAEMLESRNTSGIGSYADECILCFTRRHTAESAVGEFPFPLKIVYQKVTQSPQ